MFLSILLEKKMAPPYDRMSCQEIIKLWRWQLIIVKNHMNLRVELELIALVIEAPIVN